MTLFTLISAIYGQVIKGLREVPDKKGTNYFSMALIEEAAVTAVNVAEIQAADLAIVYAEYVPNLSQFNQKLEPEKKNQPQNCNPGMYLRL